MTIKLQVLSFDVTIFLLLVHGELIDLNESILQFGGGNFIRAFVDLFVHQANAAGQRLGQVVVVQSTPGQRAEWINAQAGRFHVLVRGLEHGKRVEQVQPVTSIARALVAEQQWDQVLAVASQPSLRWVVSNTTEAGLALDAADQSIEAIPRSFPAKLLAVLRERYHAGLPGLTILPCELVDYNAVRLLELVLNQATYWQIEEGLVEWIRHDCHWVNTLVDRIVSGRPADHELLATDQLLTVAEPFAFWALEAGPETPLFEHPCMHRVESISSYGLRKVRILNGVHSALVSYALPRGFETVRQALEDGPIRAWLEQLVNEEIVPVVATRVEDAAGFAQQMLERFANPFMEHKLSAIALHHKEKVAVRLIPTYNEYKSQFGHVPPLLASVLEPYLMQE